MTPSLVSPTSCVSTRYGKTVVSDPRRASRLLKVLKALQTADNKAAGSAENSGGQAGQDGGSSGRGRGNDETAGGAAVPTAAADQDAWLQWGYYEATALVRQYGDLLEEVKGFLGTGTTTVGECALLIEEQLR